MFATPSGYDPVAGVGMDAHKHSIAVAVLFPDRPEAVEWTEAATPEAIRRLGRELRRDAPGEVRCCYEAGPTTSLVLLTDYDASTVGHRGRARCRLESPSRLRYESPPSNS